jgi:acetyl-CoA C-acetyltransferase
VAPEEVGHVVFGNVLHTETKDMYMSRVCAINGGIPKEVPALTLNRLCGSGLQAIVSAAQIVALGDADIAVAGGVESMSRANYWLPAARWGAKMGDQVVVDSLTGALSDPFDAMHMGVTAENVAAKYGLTRAVQDEFSVESHRRAANAIQAAISGPAPSRLGCKGTKLTPTNTCAVMRAWRIRQTRPFGDGMTGMHRESTARRQSS